MYRVTNRGNAPRIVTTKGGISIVVVPGETKMVNMRDGDVKYAREQALIIEKVPDQEQAG
jgi:hypothetical protein